MVIFMGPAIAVFVKLVVMNLVVMGRDGGQFIISQCMLSLDTEKASLNQGIGFLIRQIDFIRVLDRTPICEKKRVHRTSFLKFGFS